MLLRKDNRFLFAAGCLLMAMTLLPCLLLGENAVFTYHDQLDGEVIAYLLHARHLGDGSFLPEFMGGMDKTALTPPAPAAVLLFRFFSPWTALFLMQAAGILMGYAGMYLLVSEVTGSAPAALGAGVLYGMIPFLPVYGLSQFGLPLLLWCLLILRKRRGKMPFILCYGLFFALNSSLVLAGFAVLGTMAVWILWVWRKERRFPGGEVYLWAVMAGVYLVINIRLILQVLGFGTEAVISHKTEYVLAAEPVCRGFVNAFLYGGQHSADHHLGILGLVALFLAVGGFRGRRAVCTQDRESGKTGANITGAAVVGCLMCNIVFAAVSALWNSSAGIGLRRNLGAAGAFQMDRFLWLSPCLWYLLFGCLAASVCAEVYRIRERDRGLDSVKPIRMLCVTGSVVLCMAVFAGTGVALFKDSDVKSNIQKMRNPDYPVLSYEDYYAIGVLDQVRDYLQQERGISREEYRVVSLGIDPAAALYHGFYCLDGYSNNYDLEYKHAFRRVIAPALSQSEYLRAYFDDWGNRCYVFGTESPGYYTIEKNGFYFAHLEMDTEALAELGGDYLLSAAYIANSEELGLTLLREDPFETPDSYYRIFLYEVADGT